MQFTTDVKKHSEGGQYFFYKLTLTNQQSPQSHPRFQTTTPKATFLKFLTIIAQEQIKKEHWFWLSHGFYFSEMSLPLTLEQLLASGDFPFPRRREEDQLEDPRKRTAMSDNSCGEDHEARTHGPNPKKRAETWVQDETLCLIALRREMDRLFNTSKSNKHLWEQISAKMREKGFERSPTMCTDKWRNLLKEYKKAKHHSRVSAGTGGGGGGGLAKMACYKELEELLKERGHKNLACKGCVSLKRVDSFLQFAEKGIHPCLKLTTLEADCFGAVVCLLGLLLGLWKYFAHI